MAKENFYEGIGKYTPDKLISGGDVPILVSGITLAAGQGILKRGTVVGIESTNKKGKVVDNTSTDGSEKPVGILTDDVDTDSEVTTTMYISGLFNRDALIFGGDDIAEDHELRLRELGIFLRIVL